MTREESIEQLNLAIDLIKQNGKDWLDDRDIPMLEECIKALSQEPTFDDECQKDMDEAWEQIQKKRKRISVTLDLTPCDDAISRKAVLNLKHHKPEYGDMIYAFDVEQLPSVTQKSGKCKNCKYFEYDSVAKVDGIPLIVAHEICSRWGDGCKTKEDGYCFLYEPQERSNKE